jgi:hypothetical protein
MRLTKGKQYRFDWLDTYSFIGWHNEEEINDLTMKCLQKTVGFFVKEIKDWYVLATHHNPHNNFKDWGTVCWIPKKSVKKIKNVS